MDINNAYGKIVEKLDKWLDTFITMLPNLALAILIVIIFYIGAKLFKKFSYKILNRFSHHEAVNNLLSKVVFLAVAAVGFFFALGVLQLDEAVFSLLAGVGILGLALGFAFQDMAANFMSGIALAIEQPFKVGDIIESKDFFGTVKKITLRTTNIITLQGQLVFIPNKDVFQNPLINFSATGIRRADIKIGISYGDDLEKVKQVTLNAVKDIPNQAAGKQPEVFFEEFGDSSINLVLRIWHNYHMNKDYKKVVNEAVMKVKKAYDSNDIMIPFPIRTLDFGIKGGEKLNEVLDKQNGRNNENE